MRKIMVMNLGSTSFKFKLFEMGETENCLASGAVESIGARGTCAVRTASGEKKEPCACRDHMEALDLCLRMTRELGTPVELSGLDAVGYKAVHGGSISGARRVDGALLEEMERMVPFAPAHNPVYIAMMRSVGKTFPGLTQIACFETAFHAGIPEERAVYGVPWEWMKEDGVRRYGFHGSSHSYIAWRMGKELPGARRLISVHLGGSSSLCAVLDSRSVAASMGATPQSGIFQNNRVGDFDVFCLPALTKKYGSTDAVMRILSSGSGLKGLSGVSNDMRAVEEAALKGDPRAGLAIRAFEDGIVGYIGMFTAYLGGLDAVCFTGGIGTHDAALRSRVAKKLGFVRAVLDEERNLSGLEGRISAPDSGVEVWALETNEELMVARGCVGVLEG